MDFVYPELGLKIIDVLTKHGCEVGGPRGAELLRRRIYFSGDVETGRMLAELNIKAFKGRGLYRDRAAGHAAAPSRTTRNTFPTMMTSRSGTREFEKKVKDSTEFPDRRIEDQSEEFKLKKEFEGKTATWHDPCHLIRYQNIKEQPRAILKALKGLKYVEMPNADMCCGMGGSFSVYHYDLTKKIAKKKMVGITATGADIVVTACPGCMINLIDNVLQNKMPQKVHHFLELVE